MDTGIYIRVSTDEQAKHGYSIRAQKEKLLSYAKLKDWKVHRLYIDEGLSGKDLNRCEVQNLIDDVKEGRVKNVLVFKIDRLTRSTKDLIDLIELFQKYNCEFNSLTEAIDTSSPTGRMFIKIIGLFAEFERETIVERIKVGLERKVKEGYSLCSSTSSYGYSRKKGQKIQEIDALESSVVKRIFSWYLHDLPIGEITKRLNSEKILTKKNKKWTNGNIINILSNPNYIGNVRYGINTNKYFEVKGRHQQIIDERDFLMVQNKLKNRMRTKDDAYYSNKLECLCNDKMYTKRTYINDVCYINYICKNAKCPFKSISHNRIDRIIGIKNLSFDERKRYVQDNIEKIVITSLNKSFILVNNKNTLHEDINNL